MVENRHPPFMPARNGQLRLPTASSARVPHPARRELRTMLDVVKQASAAPKIPFDTERLDRLMDEAGIDVLVTTSKHNVQYLLAGHRAFFFASMDAISLSRYLPVLPYPTRPSQQPPLS